MVKGHTLHLCEALFFEEHYCKKIILWTRDKLNAPNQQMTIKQGIVGEFSLKIRAKILDTATRYPHVIVQASRSYSLMDTKISYTISRAESRGPNVRCEQYIGSFCPMEGCSAPRCSLVSPAAETRRSLQTQQAYLYEYGVQFTEQSTNWSHN